MQKLSLRNIEILTGIKAHTFRLWEKRYDLFAFSKSRRQQRIFSDDELKKLLRLAFLYHNGWTITSLMALPDDKTEAEVQRIQLTATNYYTGILHLLHATVDLNEAAFVAALDELINAAGVEKTVVGVYYPYLLQLHALWKTTRAPPVQQRFSSYLIQTRLISETAKLSPAQDAPPELVLFSPEKDANDLPLLFLNYMLRKAGWKVLYLGINNRLADVKHAAALPSVYYLYLHLAQSTEGFLTDDYLETLRKNFPGKIIFASGKGIEQSQRSFVRVYLLRNDEAIYRMIASKKQLTKSLSF